MDPVPTERAEPMVMPVGEQLREAREAQGLTIGDVAERTRIPSRHIAAIEGGDHANLPAATYSSGFVKTYARLLGLDGQALSQDFRGELGSTGQQRSVHHEIYAPADPARTPPRSVAWIAAAIAVIALLGFLYWRGTQSENPVAVAAAGSDVAAPAPAPVVAPAPAPAPIAAAPAPATGPVVLAAESAVWLRISDTGGKKLFEGMLDAGKSFTVPADAADPRLLTGRPNALHVTVGSTVIAPLGPPEQRVRDVSLKADALIARNGPEAAAANPVPLPANAPTPIENAAGPN